MLTSLALLPAILVACSANGASHAASSPASQPATTSAAPVTLLRNGPIAIFAFEHGLVAVNPRTGHRGRVLVGCPHSCGGEIMDADWSPDGSRVALVWTCEGACRPTPDRYGLYVADRSTGEMVRIANGLSIDAVDWSADGSRIAYLTGGSIIIVDPDGTDPVQLTNHPGLEGDSLSWSPDGTQIAVGDGMGGVYVVHVDGSAPQLLAEDARFPAWSPDGSTIAVRIDCKLVLMPADGGAATATIDLSALAGGTRSRRCGDNSMLAPTPKPVWSPDGSSLVIPVSANAIAVVRADGSDPTVLRPFHERAIWGTLSWPAA